MIDCRDTIIPSVLLHCENSVLVFEHLTKLSAVTARLRFHMSQISNWLHAHTCTYTNGLGMFLFAKVNFFDLYHALKRIFVRLSSLSPTYVSQETIWYTWVTIMLPKSKKTLVGLLSATNIVYSSFTLQLLVTNTNRWNRNSKITFLLKILFV